jgi:MarC family membrane protein
MKDFISTALLFFLVIDPVGNLPLFIATLGKAPPERYRPIVIRESTIALGLMLVFMFSGNHILSYLNLSKAAIELAGGIILFLISIKMIFGGAIAIYSRGTNPETESDEPLIVPLAIPFIAGPAALSTCLLLGGTGYLAWTVAIPALITAWLLATLILLCGRWASRLLGTKLLSALEALMGLILVALSAEMLIKGIKMAFNLGA